MNKSGLAAAIAAALFYSFDSAAFQLGQLHGNSSREQPLAARVELYGLSAAEAARLELTLKPDIRLAHDDPARGVIAAIEAHVARDAAGQPYIALRSGAPLGLARLAFRLRARLGERASIAHLELDLPPSTPPPRRARTPSPSAPPRAAGGIVPVRPGDSLWRILDAHGLAGGDVAATMERVVADNPHAFVDGDANRLRVGVMLHLPAARGATAATPPQPASAPAPRVAPRAADTASTPPALAARRAALSAREEDLQARLDALGEKFAAIRARYASGTPSVAAAEPPVAPASAATTDSAPADAEAGVSAPIHEAAATAATVTAAATTAPIETPAVQAPPPASLTPAASVQARPAAAQPAGALSTTTPRRDDTDAVLPQVPVSRLLLLAVAGTISLVALVSGIGTALRRLRARRRPGTERTADEEKVAEIARKATRRLELEEDVRRRLDGQRNAPGADAGDAAARGTSDSRFGTIDTHLAHGQYRQAEALLGDIIAAAPDNYRAGLRLLELYYLERRGEDFAALASALQREHRDDIDDEAWQRVMRMGKVLTPNHPPFSGPVALARTA